MPGWSRRTTELLAGVLPSLATGAALLADAAWRRAQRRRVIQDHLSYPLASLAMVVVIAMVLSRVIPATPWYGAVASAGWTLVPLGLLTLLGVAPWLPLPGGCPAPDGLGTSTWRSAGRPLAIDRGAGQHGGG